MRCCRGERPGWRRRLSRWPLIVLRFSGGGSVEWRIRFIWPKMWFLISTEIFTFSLISSPYLEQNHPHDLMMKSVLWRDCQGKKVYIHTASVSSTWGGDAHTGTALPSHWPHHFRGEGGGCLLVETVTKGLRGFLSKPLSHLAWLTWKCWGANHKAEHLNYSAQAECRSVTNEAPPVGNSLTHITFL